MKILSAQQLAEADKSTIEKQQITSIDLMERVATLVVERLHARLNGAPVPIKIFCGIGNNGGDGLAIARLMIQHGYHVTTYVTNCSKKRSKDFLVNYDRIKDVTKDWPILLSCKEDFPEITPKDIVIDAVFGTGLNRPVTGWMADLFNYINSVSAFTVAIDMPSGLYANEPHDKQDAIVKADHTFTFQTPKLSFFLPETGNQVGTFEVLNIGLDPEYLMQAQPLAQLIAREAAQNMYRQRDKFVHKGNLGHVLCMGGSHGMMGSISLTAGAAINAGAGKVSAYIPSHGNTIVQTLCPEVMTLSSKGEQFITDFEHVLKDYVLCVGPGMGQEEESYSAFAKAVHQQSSPMIIDADAINLLASNHDLLEKLPKNSILTPHDGELKRLIGDWKNDYERLEKAKEFSAKHDLILVLKGAYTITVAENHLYVNDSGNPGMATAGSGDVLAGVIASFVAQGYDPLIATVFGVHMHGASGDLAAQTYAHEGLKASIISNFIGPAILNLFRNPENKPQNA
ncbi:carbohydrate kinase [Nonlabens spongiae]|uniref:Bifunctional NAD(P)H-hydrate repair enzyme n=1 Tax=Nonlabens spongiae TaxID=331648 RepID=A0A1W6MGU8_9FLAO|nr:NAD(P)H-hydrate dehydratase [Nonlabens spongiae]ARN76831.1 carbohydrate kinase [Nonlabens spongiae]